jgi:hypothetical protein
LRNQILAENGSSAKACPERTMFDDLAKGFPDIDPSAGMNAAGQLDEALRERSVHHLSEDGLR